MKHPLVITASGKIMSRHDLIVFGFAKRVYPGLMDIPANPEIKPWSWRPEMKELLFLKK